MESTEWIKNRNDNCLFAPLWCSKIAFLLPSNDQDSRLINSAQHIFLFSTFSKS